MPQVVLSNTDNVERFYEVTGSTLEELRTVMNLRNEGTSQVTSMGQAQDGTWYAMFDRALQVVLTMDDLLGINDESEFEPSSDAVLRTTKLDMSA